MIKSQVRLPDEVKAWLDREATRHERSMNAQIVWALKQVMAAQAADQSEETSAPGLGTCAPASRVKPEGTGHDCA